MYKTVLKLQNIVTRKGSSKILTFSSPHVFKALQMLSKQKYVSRVSFCSELHIGEGAVRTMITHLKQDGLVDAIRAGTFLTINGKKFAKKFSDVITSQCNIKSCNIAREKHNHVILIKNRAKIICNGMDQRDFAILYGAKSATTLLFQNEHFVFPNENKDALIEDSKTKKTLLEKLMPQEDDIIIIASSNDSFVSEISAINSALLTLAAN
ncbi:MAG: hypothetical protein HRU07_06145 [Nitrosopumilus sp.]|nr:hypothetical protein [Nitrosopumilus sp.]NRA05725.1 hypothetical protein [Nitrosopumilus sp.]